MSDLTEVAAMAVYRRGESPAVGRVREYIVNIAREQGGEGGEFIMSIWAASRYAGITRNTAQKAVTALLLQGVIEDLTPDLTNAPHKYRLDWGKVGGFSVSVRVGVDRVPDPR